MGRLIVIVFNRFVKQDRWILGASHKSWERYAHLHISNLTPDLCQLHIDAEWGEVPTVGHSGVTYGGLACNVCVLWLAFAKPCYTLAPLDAGQYLC